MAIVSTGSITLIDLNDSKQISAFIGSSQKRFQIYNPNNNSYDPHWPSAKPVLTPSLYVTGGSTTDIIAQAKSIKWFVDGTEITASTTDYTLAASGVKTLTINTNVLASVTSKRFEAEIVWTDTDTGLDTATRADFEFAKVTSGTTGASAVTAVLSNESATISTLADGSGGVYTGAVSTLSIFEGSTDVTASYTIVQTRTGATVTEAASSRTATVTAMSTDTASILFTATRSGYPTLTKTFNLAKNKQGVAGTTPTSYWLDVDATAIQKNIAGAYTPASINVSGRSQVGTAAPGTYAARFIISDSTDGTTFTARYTSAANETTKNYVPSAGIKALKVVMYAAGGTATPLDEQLVVIVSDGATGADAVRAMVTSPEGNVFKNQAGTLKALCEVYKGSTLQSATYKWYLQDPTATTASGGDADGGNGWRLINATFNAGVTNYTTNTITIPASAVTGFEAFKCVATYSGVKYSDTTSFVDISDPISTTIIGGDKFKNGQGTVTLTAKLSQAGAEIDAAGTKYTYTWSLYDMAGVKVTNWNGTGSKVGKTITVAAIDITQRGNLICDIND